MYYSNGFDSTYEELITFYPAFYRDVFEMRAILEAEGKIIDNTTATINGVIENSFVETADETMITRLEAWLHIDTDKSQSLEERRKDVNAYFVGSGKLSASKLKSTLKALTGVDSDIRFTPTDDSKNNTLIIEMQYETDNNINYLGIEKILTIKLPSHIAYKVLAKTNVSIFATPHCAAALAQSLTFTVDTEK